MTVQGSWSQDERGRSRTSREDLMMVLQNVDHILIKAGYDENQDEVRYGVPYSATTGRRSYRRSVTVGSTNTGKRPGNEGRSISDENMFGLNN